MIFHAFSKKLFPVVVFFISTALVIAPVASAQNVATTYMAQMAGMKPPMTAQTGVWQWQDISDKLPVRDGRPIWAIAQLYDYW